MQVRFTPVDPAREVTLGVGRVSFARIEPLDNFEIWVSNILDSKYGRCHRQSRDKRSRNGSG
jgi:hypothetical protein